MTRASRRDFATIQCCDAFWAPHQDRSEAAFPRPFADIEPAPSEYGVSAVFLKGWYCEASGSVASPWELACDLDSLTIDRKQPSAEADGYLRSRMKRAADSSSPVTQTTDIRTCIPKRKRL